MNIYELEKRATPGIAVAEGSRAYLNGGELWIASTDMPGAATEDEINADARLLAHCRNHFMEALKALKQEHYSGNCIVKEAGMSNTECVRLCPICALIHRLEEVE